MRPPVIVLDSGALDAAARDNEVKESLRQFREDGWTVVVPTVVLAEAITGRPSDAPVDLLLKQHHTVDSNVKIARRAGRLRHRAIAAGTRRKPSGVDALVAAHAVVAGRGVVVTSDPKDHRLLLADNTTVEVLDV
jgi:predicted nucleic acid-binding protein